MMPDNATNTGEEKVIQIMHEHWIKYVFPTFVYIMMTSASLLLFVLAGTAAHHSEPLSHASFILALLLCLFTHHWFFTRLIGEAMTHIVITNRRIVYISVGLFGREEIKDFAFDRMRTVDAQKNGLLQTILRYGTISFDKGGELRMVPHPNRVAKEIEQAIGLR